MLRLKVADPGIFVCAVCRRCVWRWVRRLQLAVLTWKAGSAQCGMRRGGWQSSRCAAGKGPNLVFLVKDPTWCFASSAAGDQSPNVDLITHGPDGVDLHFSHLTGIRSRLLPLLTVCCCCVCCCC